MINHLKKFVMRLYKTLHEQAKKNTISARSDLAPTAKLSFDRSKFGRLKFDS